MSESSASTGKLTFLPHTSSSFDPGCAAHRLIHGRSESGSETAVLDKSCSMDRNQEYRSSLLLGLVVSVGGITEHTAKDRLKGEACRTRVRGIQASSLPSTMQEIHAHALCRKPSELSCGIWLQTLRSSRCRLALVHRTHSIIHSSIISWG